MSSEIWVDPVCTAVYLPEVPELETAEERFARHTRRDRYWNNPEKEREASRLWRAAHPEKERETHRRWKAAHPEKVREQNRRYRAAHPEKVREYWRRYRAAHPEKEREYWRRYYEAHRDEILARQRAQRAMTRQERATTARA